MYFNYLRGSSGADSFRQHPVTVKQSKPVPKSEKASREKLNNGTIRKESRNEKQATFDRIFMLIQTIRFIFSLNKNLSNSCEYMNAEEPHKYRLFWHLLLNRIVTQFQDRKPCHFTGIDYTITPVYCLRNYYRNYQRFLLYIVPVLRLRLLHLRHALLLLCCREDSNLFPCLGLPTSL